MLQINEQFFLYDNIGFHMIFAPRLGNASDPPGEAGKRCWGGGCLEHLVLPATNNYFQFICRLF